MKTGIEQNFGDSVNRSYEDTVIAWRHDGLCERLLAITIGYFTAKACKLKFGIVWPGEDALKAMFANAGGHSLPDNPREILSETLCAQCLIDESLIPHPAGKFYFHSPEYNRLVVNSFQRISELQGYSRPCFLASNRRFRDVDSVYGGDRYRDFFYSQLFSSEVCQQLEAIKTVSLPRRRVAIHVRGGDIIYGETRLVANFSRLKSISLPVAVALCLRFISYGYTVLVFGATGRDIDFLRSKHEQIIGVDDFSLPSCNAHTAMIREAAIMADCDYLVSSVDTAVTKLAQLIGSAKLLCVPGWISDWEEHQILRSSIDGDDFRRYHRYQKAFVSFCLFQTAPESTGLKQLYGYIKSANFHDRANVSYALQALLCAAAVNDFHAAEKFKVEVENIAGVSVEEFIDSALTSSERFLKYDGRSMQRIYSHIIQDQEMPETLRLCALKLSEAFPPVPPPSVSRRLFRWGRELYRQWFRPLFFRAKRLLG